MARTPALRKRDRLIRLHDSEEPTPSTERPSPREEGLSRTAVPDISTVPPRPTPIEAQSSVFVPTHTGRSLQLGYMTGPEADSFVVCDRLGPVVIRSFPMTDQGWQAAWDAFVTLEPELGLTPPASEPHTSRSPGVVVRPQRLEEGPRPKGPVGGARAGIADGVGVLKRRTAKPKRALAEWLAEKWVEVLLGALAGLAAGLLVLWLSKWLG